MLFFMWRHRLLNNVQVITWDLQQAKISIYHMETVFWGSRCIFKQNFTYQGSYYLTIPVYSKLFSWQYIIMLLTTQTSKNHSLTSDLFTVYYYIFFSFNVLIRTNWTHWMWPHLSRQWTWTETYSPHQTDPGSCISSWLVRSSHMYPE